MPVRPCRFYPVEETAMNAHNPTSRPSFQWDDPLSLDTELTEEERLVRDTARDYCQAKLLPRVKEAFREEKTDPSIFREMGELRSEEHTSELQSLMRISYAVFCLKKTRHTIRQDIEKP